MKKTSKKIVFFGNERLATGVSTTAPTLRALVDAGYEVCAVVTNYQPPRSRKTRSLEIAAVADEYNIPLLMPQRLKDVSEQLLNYSAVIGVLVAYGKIVPQSIIDIFPRGIVNIHPSLLPRHRGPTPIESVLLSGETETGVSLMQLHKDMDAGPIYSQTKYALQNSETKQQLANSLLSLGAEQLVLHLPKIIDGLLLATPQDNQSATYDTLIQKEDGIIDWTKPADQISREIRAYIGWPKSSTKLGDIEVIVLDATPTTQQQATGTIITMDGQLYVGCGQGSLLINRLQPIGKFAMNAHSFLAGYGDRIG